MAQNDVVFSISAIDKASVVFDRIGDSADQMATDAKKAFEELNASAKAMGQNAQNSAIGFNKMAGAFSIGALGAMGFAKAISVAGDSVSEFFKANAEFEKYSLQFKVLLGSTQEAQKRIAELQKFASETPFELAGIAQASKVLQTFGGSALATGDSLRMVGDASAMAGVSIEELAGWIGRAYSGLQSGRPIGEAMQRFQELGLVSGETRNKIEDLQKVGKNQEAWIALEASLNIAKGTMKDLSMTLDGLKSTIQDDLTNAFVVFGQNSGIIEAVRLEMIGLHDSFSSGGDSVKEFGVFFKDEVLPPILVGIELFKAGADVVSFFGTTIWNTTGVIMDMTEAVQRLAVLDAKGAINALKHADDLLKDVGKSFDKAFLTTDHLDVVEQKLIKINEAMNKTSGEKKPELDREFKKGSDKNADKEADKLKKKQEEDERKKAEKQAEKDAEKKEKDAWEDAERIAKIKQDRRAQDEFLANKAVDDELARRAKLDEDDRLRNERELEYQRLKQETISMAISGFAQMASLMGEHSEIAKAAAMAEAIWNTSVAVTKALTLPPPFGQIQAGIVGAMGAVQVAKIAQYEKGGIVQGKRHSQGGVMAELEGGEFVYSRKDVQAMGGVTALDRMRKASHNISLGGFSPVINIHTNSNKIDGTQVVKALEKSMPEFSKMLSRQTQRGFKI